MKTRRRYVAPPPFWAIPDAPVWWNSPTGARLAAVIDRRSWLSAQRLEWMVRLRDVETSCGRSTVAAACVRDMEPRLVDEPGAAP